MKTSNLQLVLSSLNVEASQFTLDLITKAVLNDLEASRTQVPKEDKTTYGRYPSLSASIPKDIHPSQYADIDSLMRSEKGGDSPRVTPKEINDLLNDIQKELMEKYYDTEAIRHINGESAVEWERKQETTTHDLTVGGKKITYESINTKGFEPTGALDGSVSLFRPIGKKPIDPPVEPSQHYRNGDGC